jgi:hypothetical protein
MSKVIRIERIGSDYLSWEPIVTADGYQLIDRKIPYPDRNYRAKAYFTFDADKAGDLIEKDGYGIRMGERGATRGNYIYPEMLRVIR